MKSARFDPPAAWSLPAAAQADALFDRLDEASRRGETRDAFYALLLETTAETLGATAVEHWTVNEGAVNDTDAVRLAGRVTRGGEPRGEAEAQADTRCVRDAIRESQALSWRADSGPRVAARVLGASGPVAAVVAVLPRRASAGAVDAAEHLLATLVDTAERFELRQLAKQNTQAERRQTSAQAFCARLLQEPDAASVARATADALGPIAGEGRRVTTLLRRGGRWRVAAVGGAREHSSRSDAVRRIERLADTALAAGDPLWRRPDGVADTEPPTPAPVAEAADRYADESDVAEFWIAPFAAPGAEGGPNLALLVESFDAPLDADLPERLTPLATLAAAAAQREPGGLLAKLARAAGRRRTAIGAALVLVTALLAVLLGVEGDLEVAAEGRLTPARHARLFAPRDAIVDEVLVAHGDKVAAGQAVLRLKSPDLDVQREQLAEAMALTRQELQALKTEQLRTRPGGAEAAAEAAAMAARQVALAEQLKHQQRRAEVLDEEAARLEVVSPLAGEVISWRPGDYLLGRAVQRGQRLVEVAAAEGPQRLELDVPDHLAGRVLSAAGAEPLAVRYVVKASPGEERRAVVSQIAASTTLDSQGAPVVRVEAAPQGDAAPDARGGARVAAKIDCGRKRLATVWFYEAWDALRRAWF